MPDSIEIAHLSEVEGVSGEMIKCRLLLVLDHLLESVNSLVVGNLNCEDAPRIITITEDTTVELKCVRHVAMR